MHENIIPPLQPRKPWGSIRCFLSRWRFRILRAPRRLARAFKTVYQAVYQWLYPPFEITVGEFMAFTNTDPKPAIRDLGRIYSFAIEETAIALATRKSIFRDRRYQLLPGSIQVVLKTPGGMRLADPFNMCATFAWKARAVRTKELKMDDQHIMRGLARDFPHYTTILNEQVARLLETL